MKFKISGEAVRIALFYFAYSGIAGFYTPYWPVFLQSRGLGPGEIGIIYACGSLLRPLVAPAYGFIADRYLGLRRVLIVLAVANAVALLGFADASGFWPILAVTLAVMACWPPMMPLADALALSHQARGRLTYGRVRLWGSVSYILMNLTGGVVIATAGPNAIWAAMMFFAVVLIAMAFLQKAPPPAHAQHGRPNLAELWQVLTMTPLGLALIAASLIDASHTLYYGFATIHWRAIGIPANIIGYLWSIGVVAEVGLLAFAGRWLKNSSGLPFMIFAGCSAIVRWCLLSIDLPLPLVFLVQLLHALTYSVNLMGIMAFIGRHAPHRFSGSVQGIYAALSTGVFASTAIAVSGQLYARIGAHAYLAMAVMALAGACLALYLMMLERSAESGADKF